MPVYRFELSGHKEEPLDPGMRFVVVGCSGSFSFFFCQDKNKDIHSKELYRLDPRYLTLCDGSGMSIAVDKISMSELRACCHTVYDIKVVFLSASASPITSLIISKQLLQLLCIFFCDRVGYRQSSGQDNKKKRLRVSSVITG